MHSTDIRTVQQLESFLHSKKLTWKECGLPDPTLFDETFPVRIPLFYANLIDWKNPNDPLRLMVIPDQNEKDIKEYELLDPIGDTSHEPVPGLIHRYPDRCLFLFTTHCAVHCRFCFRRDVIGQPRPAEILNAIEYIKNHTEIREVIFTGGDPGIFPAGFLENIFQKLSPLSHVKAIRFHTRALVSNPVGITPTWITSFDLLSQQKVVVLHINHVREISEELKTLVQNLLKNNFKMYSQSVLLKGVNNSSEDLKQLFLGIVDAGITPYYLHHLDYARGTHHFRISVEEGKKLFSSLRGKIAGYALPEYVIDLPGGDGKYPVLWMKKLEGNMYEAKSWNGEKVIYRDQA